MSAHPRTRTDVRVGRLRHAAVMLLFVVVALSVVVMHHVVAAHEHAGPGAAQPAGPSAAAVAPGTPGAPRGGGPVAHAIGELAAAGPAAMLHVHHQGGAHESTMLHACPAVLAALAALLLLVVLVWWRPGALAGLLVRGAVPDVPVRGPPVPRRLAQLQVLRL